MTVCGGLVGGARTLLGRTQSSAGAPSDESCHQASGEDAAEQRLSRRCNQEPIARAPCETGQAVERTATRLHHRELVKQVTSLPGLSYAELLSACRKFLIAMPSQARGRLPCASTSSVPASISPATRFDAASTLQRGTERPLSKARAMFSAAQNTFHDYEHLQRSSRYLF